MREHPQKDGTDQHIIQIVKEEKPETVEQLVKLTQNLFPLPKQEILNRILNLQEKGKLRLKPIETQTPETFTDYLRSSRASWYWTTLILACTTALLTFVIPENAFPLVYVRYILGSIFVLWLPGYAFIKALFPTKLPIQTSSRARGSAWRLKPDMWVPKPKLKVNNETLLSHQINWLRRNGIDRIILAADRPNLIDDPHVIHSLEEKKLGTGGAVKKAAEHVKEKRVYVMNVDDIVFYDPTELYEYADKGAAVLMAKPTLPFGRIQTVNTYVVRFEQKPRLDCYVNVGHYVFKTAIINQYFPDQGDLELQTLQQLADKNMVKGYPYHGIWLTINTLKDLLKARAHFERHAT